MSGGRIVALDRLPEGARLAADVCDAGGHTLLAAGTELGAAAVVSLRKRGVSRVRIEETVSAEELAARRAALAARLAHLFRDTEDDPLMSRLHQVVLAYRLEQPR